MSSLLSPRISEQIWLLMQTWNKQQKSNICAPNRLLSVFNLNLRTTATRRPWNLLHGRWESEPRAALPGASYSITTLDKKEMKIKFKKNRKTMGFIPGNVHVHKQSFGPHKQCWQWRCIKVKRPCLRPAHKQGRASSEKSPHLYLLSVRISGFFSCDCLYFQTIVKKKKKTTSTVLLKSKY